jgi:hypothetical protein
MILTTEQLQLLTTCIGGGPLNKASIVIFGNELGTAEGKDTNRTIQNFERDWAGDKIVTDPGFATLNIGTPPVNSTFLQFIARLVLGLNDNNDRYFEKLEPIAKVLVNNYIMNRLYKFETAIINLRPLPQSTERHWDYENISEKDYYKQYNFTLRNRPSDPWSDLRVKAIKSGFDLAKNAIILGSGDKNNKRAFFELIYPDIEFRTITLNLNTQVYVAKNPNIILSNYYDNRNGIRLSGLFDIYQYIKNENLLKDF